MVMAKTEMQAKFSPNTARQLSFKDFLTGVNDGIRNVIVERRYFQMEVSLQALIDSLKCPDERIRLHAVRNLQKCAKSMDISPAFVEFRRLAENRGAPEAAVAVCDAICESMRFYAQIWRTEGMKNYEKIIGEAADCVAAATKQLVAECKTDAEAVSMLLATKMPTGNKTGFSDSHLMGKQDFTDVSEAKKTLILSLRRARSAMGAYMEISGYFNAGIRDGTRTEMEACSKELRELLRNAMLQ
jgi:hypothetical protein